MKPNIFHKFFTAAADTCLGKAKHHSAMADAHSAMMDEHENNSADHAFHKTAKTEHEGQAGQWAALGETCIECAKDSGAMLMSRKAAGMGDDPDAVMPLPDGLSTLAPDAPLIRAIPRFGAREIPRVSTESIFSKMFATDEAE